VRPHPAVRAWLSVRPQSRPRALETIKETPGSKIYRLAGALAGDRPVIAKCAPAEKLKIECAVYTEVLPGLQLPRLECYGMVEQGEEDAWLFLENAAGQPFDRHISPHRIAAARWLATIHVATAATPHAELPVVNPSWYLHKLREAREVVSRASLAMRSVPETYQMLDEATISLLQTESQWSVVDQYGSLLRPTLVHGDLVPRNLRVRPAKTSNALVAIDWSRAGWGLGAADLGLVDLSSYVSLMQRHWPELTLERARQAADVGKIFRWIGVVHSISATLGRESGGRAPAAVRDCQQGLSKALAELRSRS